jgi:hypothetical protein
VRYDGELPHDEVITLRKKDGYASLDSREAALVSVLCAVPKKKSAVEPQPTTSWRAEELQDRMR